ncbi:MAG TPA: mechanosensitive ion channel domain-containing protein [Gammaproteobacteria bacterium]|nr:mechanosensitive ion channel domain-containing protein [Gammaproteobacteria bacterium]
MDVFGVKLVGVNAESGTKLLMSIAFIVALLIIRWLLAALMRYMMEKYPEARATFWLRQVVNIILAVALFFGIASIWLDSPAHLTTAMGLVSAGLAFALQKPISALAGYLVSLRGRTFHVGDRIRLGGVRGDVIAVGFIQTTIMEMGEPPGEQADEPAMWVKARQFSGRIVTVSNSTVFDEPVYNYTRDFPYLWEELMVPITYTADRAKAEQIILEAARRHTFKIGQISAEAMHRMQERYFVKAADFEPRVFYRLTDNWLELAVRFVVLERGIRDIKDAMSREILAGLDAAGIGIASATYDIVGFPTVKVRRETEE